MSMLFFADAVNEIANQNNSAPFQPRARGWTIEHSSV